MALDRPGPRVHVSPAQLYVASLNTTQSRATAVASLRRLADLLQLPRGPLEDTPDWHAFPWEQVGPEQTTFLRASLIEKYAPATARLSVTVLRGVLKQCWRLGLMTADTYQRAIDLSPIKGKSAKAGRALDQAELEKLIAYIDTLPAPLGTMVAALFAAGLGGGLRREELATVRANALEETGLRVVGKGRKEVVQSLPKWAFDRVRAWSRVRVSLAGVETLFLYANPRLGEIVDAPPTLWSTWDLIVSIGKAAGLAHFTPHDLRRTFATRMMDKTDLVLTQRAMRHESATTTARYDRREESRVAGAIDTLEGFGFEKAVPVKEKTIRRCIQPFDTIAEVNLYEVIEQFRGACDAAEIEPLIAWALNGSIDIEVVALRHLLDSNHGEHIAALAKAVKGAGQSEAHKELIALGATYVNDVLGKKTTFLGKNDCAYAGGNADVAALDGSFFVECGTLTDRKVRCAMEAGQTVMVIPYNLGCVIDKKILRMLAWPQLGPEATNADWLSKTTVNLGYIFSPKRDLSTDSFEGNVGSSLLGAAAMRMKTIDVPKKALATIGDVLKAKGPTLTRAVSEQESAAPETIPGAAVPSPVRKDPQRRKIKVDGQELVEAPRGRIVRVRFRRDGKPLDEHWATMQCQRLAGAGKSNAVILATLAKIGVTRADGTALEVADVTRLL